MGESCLGAAGAENGLENVALLCHQRLDVVNS